MRKLNLVLALVISASLLSGCKLNKMIKLAKENDLKVVPNPLEVKGGNVPFEISSKLPPKMLPSNTSFTLNTIYKYGSKEVKVGSVEFKASDFPKSSSTPSTKSQKFSFQYQEGMNPGKLYIEGVAKDLKSGKTKTTERMEVAQGLVLTALNVQKVGFPSYAEHGYNDSEELEPTNINFFFDQGRSKLRSSLNTDGESTKDRKEKLKAFIADKNVTRTVTITGGHSPEGTETVNSELSGDRANAIQKFYKEQMEAYDYQGAAKDIKFITKPVIQEWSKFRTALAAYDGIEDSEKSKYLDILNGSGSFVEKEKAFKKLPSYKKVFKKVYPLLRTAQTNVLTVKPKKSKAQISTLAKAIVNGNAKEEALTTEEMMYAASLTPSAKEKADIYKVVAKNTGSWQAHNNLGAAYLELATAGDNAKLDDAATQLEIASNKNSSSPIVQSNAGAVKLLQGNYGEAYTTLRNISGGDNDVTPKVNAMKGAVEVMNGQYDIAKNSFNNAKMNDESNINKGIANLMTKNYGAANAAFGMISNKSDKYGIAQYLTAVAAARQNKTSEMSDALRKAVVADPSLKSKILNDLEFAKKMDAVKQAIK